MYYFYVLQSEKDKKLYKGHSGNLEKRLGDHNSGKVFATRSRRPFTLIYSEAYPSREEAIAREKYFKSFKGGKELAKIIQNDRE